MGDKQREELMSSLKLLYTNGEYSDLTITCHEKHYRVHKAIVCPRSKFYTASEGVREGIVNLTDDDPRAVEMALHYLYHLDYSSMSTWLQDKSASLTSNGNGTQIECEDRWKINGHDGQVSDDPALEVVSESIDGTASLESLDDSISNTALKFGKGKKKRKKKASVQLVTEKSTIEPKDSLIEETEIYGEPAASEEAVAPLSDESLTYGNLLIHAKVYTLSKKYGIKGLKALALEKFEDDAKQKWADDDFLQAAKEVYTSTLDEHDRGMRDIITGKFYEHPELLDIVETQGVIRGLDLGYDLLKWLRVKGGFGDS